ncbi:tetratricopeptide (TPR) repeat protein [Streptomyces luteogriseus]|uniref:tetratricopeptide repeat protein n=1 Tax=Streptomyces luteogriseus TaxID=68233 RepID=UPI0027841F3C|nr:tetratricopeptide repeat protein [Streptomyces luteogriseus]MDQ0713699.1 tetratricopeptide (TPR) repeat protein [Streptomyces luteogriseus]
MENQQEGPARQERSVRRRRVLIASVAGCAVLGGVLVLLPREPAEPAPPSPGALAMAAVGSGVPAALPGLAELIGEREKAVRARPGDAASWAVLGAAYVERGRRLADPAYYPRAEKALRTSLSVRPRRNTPALAGLAALSNARRDFPAARRWGEAALKLEPRRWTTYPLLIDAYTGLGEYKAAKRTLDRLTGLRSGPAVLARAAAVYRDRGWREDAAASLADAAAGARAPAERASYLERAGQLAFERGDLDVALRHFREAVRLDPGQRAAQAGQGRTLAALGRTTEALNAYLTALAEQPSPQYALELGELYESLGMPEAARVRYGLLRERVRRAAAGGADEELVLGRFEADHGDPKAAVRRLRAEWKRQPGTEVADALGWALYRAGEPAEALRFALSATDTEPGGGVYDAASMYHRGMIERKLKRYGAARRHLTEALRINPHFSPLHAPAARAAAEALGEPPDEGVPEMDDGAG